MRFAYPYAFTLLLLIPLYYWGWRRWQQRRTQGLPLTHLKALAPLGHIGANFSWATFIAQLCLLLFWVGLVSAIARPQMGQTVEKSKVRGVDIILAVDTSLSMLAEDLKPNRLAVAKEVIQQFIQIQNGNRLGVVVFAGQSYTLLPLSTDYAMVSESVADIEIDMIDKGGTAIGDAIANGVYRFKDDNPKSRVIILLTDGEKTEGIDPVQAAKVAGQRGIKIHTIGLGKREGAPIPVIDRYTGRRTYARDPDGNLYLSKLKGEDLKAISKITGGQFFRADSVDTLEQVYAQINTMEKADFETRTQTLYSEKMHWFLIPALIFLLLGMLFRLRSDTLSVSS